MADITCPTCSEPVQHGAPGTTLDDGVLWHSTCHDAYTDTLVKPEVEVAPDAPLPDGEHNATFGEWTWIFREPETGVQVAGTVTEPSAHSYGTALDNLAMVKATPEPPYVVELNGRLWAEVDADGTVTRVADGKRFAYRGA